MQMFDIVNIANIWPTFFITNFNISFQFRLSFVYIHALIHSVIQSGVCY